MNGRKKKCLAIIPARGGSKRIPRKNIKNFCGQPIIKYSIDAALQSGCFDEVMVSTEDKQISDIAKFYGVKVPFFRSNRTSDDYATLVDVIDEVLVKYRELGNHFDYFCCILATAPFIDAKKLVGAFNLLINTNADSVVPVVRFNSPIQRALKIEKGFLKMFYPENYKVRSQDLISAYYDCGQFYWVKTKSFLEQKRIYAEFTIPFEFSNSYVQDIDTLQDWELAELKYKKINNIL